MPSSFTPPSVVSNVYTDKVVPNEARRMLYISFNGPNTHNSFLFSSNFNIRNRISYRITHQITNGNSRIEENPIFIGWKKKLNKNVMFHRWHELKKPTAIMLFNNFFFFCSVTTSDPRLQNAINISKGKKKYRNMTSPRNPNHETTFMIPMNFRREREREKKSTLSTNEKM